MHHVRTTTTTTRWLIRWCSRFVACRVICPFRFGWTMVTSWSWMVYPDRSMHIAQRLSCRVLGLTLHIVGLHNTLRLVHLQAWWVVFSQSVRKVWSSQILVGWGKGKISGPLLGGLVLLLLILVAAFLVSTWIHIWREHRNSGQRPSRSAAYFPSRGRARLVGGRRWRLSRRRQSPRKVSVCFPLVSLKRKKLYSFSKRVWFLIFCGLLSKLVANREPTPCYRDAFSVDTPKWAYWEKGWQIHCKTTFSPLFGRLFLISKRTIFFEVLVWMLHIGRARHPGPGKRFFTPGQLSVQFVNVGVDLWGSFFGFLCSVPGGS